MAGETVEVRVTLRGLEGWHKDTFIKRWKYWEYVSGIAVDYMLKKYLLQYSRRNMRTDEVALNYLGRAERTLEEAKNAIKNEVYSLP